MCTDGYFVTVRVTVYVVISSGMTSDTHNANVDHCLLDSNKIAHNTFNIFYKKIISKVSV